MLHSSIAHSIAIHSDWFNGIDILQGRWKHGEKVGYCYLSGLEKTLCKWEKYVPLVTKWLTGAQDSHLQRVTIPEAAYIQLRRRPPEVEQGNARNM
jgi:hypothetical protein